MPTNLPILLKEKEKKSILYISVYMSIKKDMHRNIQLEPNNYGYIKKYTNDYFLKCQRTTNVVRIRISNTHSKV